MTCNRLEPPMPRRLLIDATFTIASGKNSGIERVVCNIFRESAPLCNDRASEFFGLPAPIMTVTHNRRFYEVDDQYIEDCQRLGAVHANVLSTTPAVYRRMVEGLCDVTGSRHLRKWFLPTSGHLGIFKLSHSWQSAEARKSLARRQRPIECQPGDLLLLPDAYWINRLRQSVWPAAERARQQGAMVATLLYDLIPLTHPQYVGEKRRVAFLDYFQKAVRCSDLLLTISKTVRDQVAEFLAAMSVDGLSNDCCHDVRAFTLGAELSVSTGDVRSHVREAFAGKAPYLMVATFDPRKNHRHVLDVFDQLWREQHDVRLCLVGRIGARCDEVVNRIRTHEELGKRLFLFDDLSDAELQYCYRKSRGVVFASIVEGFGLPIVESLWFGKKTFASDTPIHREVGGEDCQYFELDTPTGLASQIAAWEDTLNRIADQGETLPPQVTRTPVGWRGSAEELLAHCLDAFRRHSTDGVTQDEAHSLVASAAGIGRAA